MSLKDHKTDTFGAEVVGYFAPLQTGKISEICFIAGDRDCLTVSELVSASGYNINSILRRKLLITIEDETYTEE